MQRILMAVSFVLMLLCLVAAAQIEKDRISTFEAQLKKRKLRQTGFLHLPMLFYGQEPDEHGILCGYHIAEEDTSSKEMVTKHCQRFRWSYYLTACGKFIGKYPMVLSERTFWYARCPTKISAGEMFKLCC